MSLALVRRRVRTAALALDPREPSPAQMRKAHLALTEATAALQARLAEIAVEDQEANRAHAAKMAKGLKDARGRERTKVTMPLYHKGRVSPNRGKKYPATPPTDNEVIRMYATAPTATMAVHGPCPSCGAGKHKGERHHPICVNPFSERFRGLTYTCWRGGFRISEALALTEDDLHPQEGYIYVAHGKNDKARMVGVDDWLWDYLGPWLTFRQAYPDGPLFCVLDGPTAGVRAWSASSYRRELHKVARLAGVRKRCAPHQLRHAAAVGQRADGIDTLDVSRNLGHSSLAVTEIYYRGIPASQTIQAIRGRPLPKISMADALRNGGIAPHDQTPGLAPDLMGVLATAKASAMRPRANVLDQLVRAGT